MATVNQKSISNQRLHKQGNNGMNNRTLETKLKQRAGNIHTTLKQLYPHREVKIEATGEVIQCVDGADQVHDVWTQPKKDVDAKWQLVQKGLLSTLRRYCNSELSNNHIRGDEVAISCGTPV